MAMNVIQDQNFSVHFDGVKTKGSTLGNKKGGLGGRKALNDISNSGKPPALHPSRKQNPKNVIPIKEDLGVSKKSAAQVSGRKALVDLTNSVKPLTQKQHALTKKKSLDVTNEGFLHNHDECIKSQKKSSDVDFDQFLKTIGLHEDVCCQVPRKSKDENGSMMFVDMEEIPEPIIEDEDGERSPIFGSPNSPSKCSYMKDFEEFPSFILSETPRRSK